MSITFGFIGCGNMGGALAKAAVASLPGSDLLLADRTVEKARSLATDLNTQCGTVEDVAAQCRYIFLGVKPQMMEAMLYSIAPILKTRSDRFILVTMAAGLAISRIQEMAGGAYPVIRIMPNTPASIGTGMILYAASQSVTDEEKEFFVSNMTGAGVLDELSEHLIDAGSAISGCGPAFVDLFVESLADGGVASGLPRDKAMLYAAQMVMGSAMLILESGEHPGLLKDRVCSPGGSTIAGVRALEQHGFRGAVMDAVEAAFQKTVDLGK